MAATPEKNVTRAHSRPLLKWYLLARLIVICFFLGGTIVYHLTVEAWAPPSLEIWISPKLPYFLYALIVIICAETALSIIILFRTVNFRRFIHVQLTWDLVFSIVVIYLTGGIDSLFSFLFILVIIVSSVFCSKYQVLLVASASAILYGSLLDLQYYGFFPLFGGKPFPRDMLDYDVLYKVFVHVGAFYLTALLGGSLAERFNRSEEAREQREVDYGELSLLNQAILTNINSGLMVINSAGRIRSFNNAASRITGHRFEEVYNRPITEIFPEFKTFNSNELSGVERGETYYRNSTEEALTLGYSASRIVDSDNNNLGLLIAFQDLTEFKALEEQLQRADRLAAVGRLASGLAHEIRNPLASISGSVQLLLEDEKVNEEDRRLMKIVIKEADRLSLLLSDFLNFARPSPLQIELIDVASMLDELIALLNASGQVQDVVIEKAYHGPVQMNVDPQKIYQILWDILINALEAVSPKGIIRVEISGAEGEIIIEDSGPGIAEGDRYKLFEPFYTTKDSGTGLGLANAYANTEAHNGRIYVEPSNLGGARFIIELPEQCRV